MHKCARLLIILAMLLFPVISSALEGLPEHDLRVRFDTEHHTMSGVSKITVPAGRELTVSLSGLSVRTAELDGRPLPVDQSKQVVAVAAVKDVRILRIEYTVSGNGAGESHQPAAGSSGNPGVVQGNLISSVGIVLTGAWYPSISGLSHFALTATVPKDFEAVSEADEIVADEAPSGERLFSFRFPHPVMGINFIAGRYTVTRMTHNGIDIYTYFLPEDEGLARSYSDHTKKYLDLYGGMLMKYPYRRFSVVENLLPTGYSMPTFTLLGQEVVRLPFIVETSLGHEILHQWFGNGVYVDYTGGNWSEGLVTYMADHLYEEQKGEGSAYRKQMLTAFRSAVSGASDFPLSAFSARTDRASAAIGYQKAAMVFHMLRRLLGDDLFYKGLKTFASENLFRPASWTTLRSVFETVSHKDLGWFFSQWVEAKGIADLDIRNAAAAYRGAKTLVTFDLLQKGHAYRMVVPVSVKTREGVVRQTVNIGKSMEHIRLEIEGSPVELVVDGDNDLFRKLTEAEYPPVLSRLFDDPGKTAIMPAGREKAYEEVKGVLGREGFAIVREQDVSPDTLTRSSLLLLGPGNAVAERLFGFLPKKEGALSAVARSNPFARDRVVVLMDSDSPADVLRYLPRLMHYGRYSAVAFEKGKNIMKETSGTASGIREGLDLSVSGVETRRMFDLPEIINRVSDKKIVYIGEIHDQFAHHRIEFEIIRALHRKNGKIAIGMEMFQRPFQRFLDAYIDGSISEKEMLKKTEYFKRWGFDYNFYREIMLYAREHRIPVVALNIPREIVEKVAGKGIYGLTKDELSDIPPDMDLSDASYRKRLRGFFHDHSGSAEKNFDFFFQAQVLWDETMAHSLNAFLRRHPDYQFVVVAGGGHMAFDSGIPARAHRLNGLDFSVVLNGIDPEKQIADYVLLPEPLPYLQSPRLMVQFAEDEKALRITDFPPGSISEKAGLRKGDVILSIDGAPMKAIDDVKICLLDKKQGDTLAVRVLRRRLFLWEEKLTFEVTL
ncbi:MAG: ChaN family lipoprotein [Nitrospiraceae bacterium]|nr:ChaN family lipoprotein [Nitrospiraceae bacterium]